MSEAPMIMPCTATSSVSAPKLRKATALLMYMPSEPSASVPRNAPLLNPYARKNGVLIGPVDATIPVA
jgi:hypothetical protein